MFQTQIANSYNSPKIASAPNGIYKLRRLSESSISIWWDRLCKESQYDYLFWVTHVWHWGFLAPVWLVIWIALTVKGLTWLTWYIFCSQDMAVLMSSRLWCFYLLFMGWLPKTNIPHGTWLCHALDQALCPRNGLIRVYTTLGCLMCTTTLYCCPLNLYWCNSWISMISMDLAPVINLFQWMLHEWGILKATPQHVIDKTPIFSRNTQPTWLLSWERSWQSIRMLFAPQRSSISNYLSRFLNLVNDSFFWEPTGGDLSWDSDLSKFDSAPTAHRIWIWNVFQALKGKLNAFSIVIWRSTL